ncbi:MAG: hypothetical protein GEU88_19145 [Solirubrobacterales bacterium]|nr:hypothetical protein [Solirubrobacterales bacterium]
MATTETHIDAPPERCFQVLSDPRSFSYWVVGSRRIRAADPNWPAVGSAFDHTVGIGPLATHDHTEVAELEDNRLLCLRAKARPFGTAYVRLELEPEDGGTLVRITERAGDPLTRILFTGLTDRLVHARNIKTLERFKELAEGTIAIPEGTLPMRDSEEARGVPPPGTGGVGIEPRGRAGEVAGGLGRGFAAGMVGAAAMSVSTTIEMKASGRAPSDVPAKALARLLGARDLGDTAERRMTAVAHVLTSGAIGGARGLLSGFGLRVPYGAPALFAMALLPDFVVVPALGIAPPPWRWSPREIAVSALHHGVFAAGTGWALWKLER